MPYKFKPKEDEFKKNPIYHPGTKISSDEPYFGEGYDITHPKRRR